MSDGPIVTKEHVKRRAARDLAEGKPCPYNWSRTGAYVTWHAETERLKEAQASPQSHIAPVAVSGFDVQQAGTMA